MMRQWTLTFKVFLRKVSIFSNLEILPFTLCQFTFNNNHSNGNLHVFVTRQLCGCFTAHVFLRQMCPRNLSTAFFVINWNKVLVQEKNQTDIGCFQSGILCVTMLNVWRVMVAIIFCIISLGLLWTKRALSSKTIKVATV